MIGSSTGKGSCARVPPNVSGNAVDGAGYLTIILGVESILEKEN
jgi:hypothetical protein